MAYSQSGYSNFQSRIEGYGNTAYDGQDESLQSRASAAGSKLASEVGATVSAFQDGSMYSTIREQAGEAASVISQAAWGVAEWFRPSTTSNGYSTPGNAYVNNNVPSYSTPTAPPQSAYPGYGNSSGYSAQPSRKPWGNNATPSVTPARSSGPPVPVQPVAEASSTARGVSGALPKGKYEAQLVKQVTAPGGTRVKPSEAVLREFYHKVRNLDLAVVGKELAKTMNATGATWQHRLRVLYVVDGLWAQGLEEPVEAVKEECAITALAELAVDPHTRAKAVPILKEWGMDVDGLATSAGVKSRGDVTASATGDLLDLGESGKPSWPVGNGLPPSTVSPTAVEAPLIGSTPAQSVISTAPSSRQASPANSRGKASAFSFVNKAPSSVTKIASNTMDEPASTTANLLDL